MVEQTIDTSQVLEDDYISLGGQLWLQVKDQVVNDDNYTMQQFYMDLSESEKTKVDVLRVNELEKRAR